MNWQNAVERTVTGLGYDLVDAEKSVGGLLRVYIDHLPAPSTAIAPAPAPEKFITVDDCEQVTRQLQHVLEVDNVAYERLEVSSPGLDRPLKKAADYARFVGEQVELTLKVPFQGRKKFRGELHANGDHWRIALADAAQGRARVRAAKPAVPDEAVGLALDFSLDEVREAHLVPVVDFKGRRFASQAADVPPGSSAEATAARPDDEIDGGRIQ